MPRRLTAGLALMLALNAGLALARSGDNAFVSDAEPDTPDSVRDALPWQEAETQLPPWPADDDLIELHLDGPRSELRFLLDGRHLAIGADAVVRYTLVIEGRNGHRNVSFEGLRCTPKAVYKLYAYGQNGRFVPIDDPQWQPISGRLSQDRHHVELWRHYLCEPRAFRPRPREEMRRLLRGAGDASEPSGFFSD